MAELADDLLIGQIAARGPRVFAELCRRSHAAVTLWLIRIARNYVRRARGIHRSVSLQSEVIVTTGRCGHCRAQDALDSHWRYRRADIRHMVMSLSSVVLVATVVASVVIWLKKLVM